MLAAYIVNLPEIPYGYHQQRKVFIRIPSQKEVQHVEQFLTVGHIGEIVQGYLTVLKMQVDNQQCAGGSRTGKRITRTANTGNAANI